MDNPLLADPTQPAVNSEGRIENPLSAHASVALVSGRAMAYRDLAPSCTYTSPGFEYLTDEHALPARVRGRLSHIARTDRVRHHGVQRTVGHLTTANEPHHGGHVVAVSLGGFASGPNLFPQSANFNVSAYARLERGWRDALHDGCRVEVDIALTIDADESTRPPFVIVTYWEDDHEVTVPLINERHAQ